MPSIADQASQAGFSKDEIAQWAAGFRAQAKSAGFSDQEIDGYLGGTVTAPSQPPEPFLKRFGHIPAWDRIVSAMGKGAESGWGSPPLGEDTLQQMRDVGMISDPDKGMPGPIRLLTDAINKPIGIAAEALGRATQAGLFAAGAGTTQALKELGAGETTAESVGREAENFLTYLGTETGLLHFAKPAVDPTGGVADVPVGALPKGEDFAHAARSVVGDAPMSAQEKLLRLYTEQGVHPAEVAADAAHDPLVTQALASRGTDLPERYQGVVVPFPRRLEEVEKPEVSEMIAPPPANRAQVKPNPGGGFDIDSNGPEGILYAKTREEADRVAAQINRMWLPEPANINADIGASLPSGDFPNAIRSFRPGDLAVDADRFQFKTGGDEAGVTERLRGVDTWDPIKAGLGLVWEDESGRNFIVDGHQRLGLASRIAEADPMQDPKMNAMVLRAADGVTDTDARIIAASKNIAEGTGTALDAAKILRDRPDLAKELPPRSELVKQARGLASLADEPFRMVINEVVPPNYAAIAGRLAPQDEQMQTALLGLLAKTEPANAVQAESIIRQGIDAGIHTDTQATLFGDQETVSSLYLDRAKILDRALRDLKRDRQVFNTIVRDEDVIQAVGNRLETSANARRLAADQQAVQILQTLANRRGPLSDALTAAARRAADGDRTGAIREFTAFVRQQSESGDLVRAADSLPRGRADVGREDAASLIDPSATAARPTAEQTATGEAAGILRYAATPGEPPPASAAEVLAEGLPVQKVQLSAEDRMAARVQAGISRGQGPLPDLEEGGALSDEQLERRDRAEEAAAEMRERYEAEREQDAFVGTYVPGEKLPVTEATEQGEQFVLPGAERSAVQAAAAREAEGHGRIPPPATQEAPGGLFAPPETPQPTFEFGPETGAISWGGKPPPAPGSLDEAQQSILSKLSIGRGTPGRGLSLSRLYTAIFDKLYPISEATEAGIPTSANPYRLSRLLAGEAGRIDHFLVNGTYDFRTLAPTGPSLQDVLAPVKDDLDGFRAFAAAARGLELEARGITTGLDLAAMRRVAREGIAKYEPTLRALVDYQNRVAAYLRDAGVLSRDGYDAMVQANQLYVPFQRVMEEGYRPQGAGGSLQAQNPIRRIEGSERDIIDPVESVIRNTAAMVSMADRNEAGIKLINMLTAQGNIGMGARTPIRAVALPPDPALDAALKNYLTRNGVDDPAGLLDLLHAAASHPEERGTISVFRDGTRYTYQVDPELAAAWKGLDQVSAGLMERIMRPFASTLRAGAVLTPDFAMRHTVRDFLYATVTSPGLFTPADMARGFLGLVNKDEDYWRWLQGGGANISMVTVDRRYLQEDIARLTEQTGLMTRAINVVADPNATWMQKGGAVAGLPFRAAGKYLIHPLQVLTELAENASHLGSFKKALREAEAAGQNIGKPEVLQAAWQSRDVAVDAARIGAKTRAYNMITAFANITLQDTDRVVRAFVNDPVGTSLKIGGGIALPSALLWWAQHDDPRYHEIPQWQRDLTWVILTDHWRDVGPAGRYGPPAPGTPYRVEDGRLQVNDGAIFRIPKPWGMGLIFGTGTERELEAFAAHNPEAFRHWGQSIADVVIPQFAPTAVAPILNQWTNRDTFTNRTLIPDQMEKWLPEYQYMPYTSEAAKAIGRIVGAFPGLRATSIDQSSPIAGGVARALSSPVLIENYIRGWTGTLGMYTLTAADTALRKAGVVPDPPQPAATLADIPVVRAFVVRYPTATAQSIQDFQDAYRANKVYYDTWLAQAKLGNAEAATRIQQLGGVRMFVNLDGIQKTLGEQNKLVRDIWKNPQMSASDKRQLIDSIYYRMIELGQAGKAAMAKIDQSLARPQFGEAGRAPAPQ